MGRRKLQLPTAPPKRNDGSWGICGSCQRERRLEAIGNIIVAHRVYHPQLGQMLDCLGGGSPAVTVTT